METSAIESKNKGRQRSVRTTLAARSPGSEAGEEERRCPATQGDVPGSVSRPREIVGAKEAAVAVGCGCLKSTNHLPGDRDEIGRRKIRRNLDAPGRQRPSGSCAGNKADGRGRTCSSGTNGTNGSGSEAPKVDRSHSSSSRRAESRWSRKATSGGLLRLGWGGDGSGAGGVEFAAFRRIDQSFPDLVARCLSAPNTIDRRLVDADQRGDCGLAKTAGHKFMDRICGLHGIAIMRIRIHLSMHIRIRHGRD